MTPRKPKPAPSRRARMGREMLTRTIPPIRVTEEQEAACERAASAAGMPLATWARMVLLRASAKETT